MKKIKSIRQLQAEKKRIRQQQGAMEKRIRESWQGVKENLRPANIAKEAIGGFLGKKTAGSEHEDSLFKTAVNFGLSILAGKLTEKAGEKISKVFKKPHSSS
jgi:hypothetical protein